MHSYLFVANDQNALNKEVLNLAKKIRSQIMEFAVKGIDDVRQMGKFSKLSLNKTTTILIRDIDKVSDEAINALLKNLEEPQENLTYFMTTTSTHKVLPTIISRCQIIRLKENKKTEEEVVRLSDNFLKMNEVERFKLLSKINDRGEAVEFVRKFIEGCHRLIHKDGSNKNLLLKAVSTAQNTLKALNSNGNVNLQLTNFAIYT
jgi:replication-associated recombination protein RarA